MKKTLVTLALLAGAVSGYSQGQVSLQDYLNTDFQITVWSPQLSGPALSGNSPAVFAAGNTANTGGDIPAGTQTGYTGVPLGGANTGAVSSSDYANGNLWTIQLYAGAGIATANPTLTAVSGAKSSMYTGGGLAGLWSSTTDVTITGINPGTQTTMAIAAWYNGNGAYLSYEAAVAAQQPAGMSSTGSENIGGGSIPPPDLPGPGESSTFGGAVTGGITSFSLTTVPEPSTIALGVIGASAFLMRLRRK